MNDPMFCRPPKYFYTFERSNYAHNYPCIICDFKPKKETTFFVVYHNGVRYNGERMEKSFSGVLCSEACMNMYKFKLLDVDPRLI